ncbi:MAG: hypothetical protein ABIR66_11950 [Saprospiraceae bacterium]
MKQKLQVTYRKVSENPDEEINVMIINDFTYDLNSWGSHDLKEYFFISLVMQHYWYYSFG